MLQWVRTLRPTVNRPKITVPVVITMQATLPIAVKRRSTKPSTTCDKIVSVFELTKCVIATHSARRLLVALRCSLPLPARPVSRSTRMFACVAVLLNVVPTTQHSLQCCAVASSKFSTNCTSQLTTWVRLKSLPTLSSTSTTTKLPRSLPIFCMLSWTSSTPR